MNDICKQFINLTITGDAAIKVRVSRVEAQQVLLVCTGNGGGRILKNSFESGQVLCCCCGLRA
jgi:hypothetical protein